MRYGDHSLSVECLLHVFHDMNIEIKRISKTHINVALPCHGIQVHESGLAICMSFTLHLIFPTIHFIVFHKNIQDALKDFYEKVLPQR